MLHVSYWSGESCAHALDVCCCLYGGCDDESPNNGNDHRYVDDHHDRHSPIEAVTILHFPRDCSRGRGRGDDYGKCQQILYDDHHDHHPGH